MPYCSWNSCVPAGPWAHYVRRSPKRRDCKSRSRGSVLEIVLDSFGMFCACGWAGVRIVLLTDTSAVSQDHMSSLQNNTVGWIWLWCCLEFVIALSFCREMFARAWHRLCCIMVIALASAGKVRKETSKTQATFGNLAAVALVQGAQQPAND